MPKYIDAEKLVLEIKKKSGGLLSGWDTAGVLAVILNQPSADVKEVVRGKWEQDGVYQMCSNCFSNFEHEDCSGGELIFPFCPSCGADMREVE